MRSILGLSAAAIVTVLLATTAGGRIAAAGPDDCSISGMGGSFACPLSTWTAPSPPQRSQAASTPACPSHYELYSSHVKWVNDCPKVSQAGPAPEPPAH